MSGHEDREELLKDQIQEQLDELRPRKTPRHKRRRWISPVALLVVAGMLLSIVIRFLMGLSG